MEWHTTCFGRSFRPSSWVHDCAYRNRRMPNRYCYCLLAGTRWNSMEFHLVPELELLKKKIYLKYSYILKVPSPSNHAPLWLDATIPAPLPLLETFAKIFNGSAVKGRQRFSLNLCNVSKTPVFWLKTKWWLCPTPCTRPTSLLRLQPSPPPQGWIGISKGGVLLILRRFNENRWRPLTAFPLQILDCFQQWERRWDRCVQSQGVCFEGD